MTKAATKSAFRKLDASEQSAVLKELAAAHAEALSEKDRVDVQAFNRRRKEEPQARLWSQVRARVTARHARQRSAAR